MNIKNWFKRKNKGPSESDKLHESRMESLRKKKEAADEIIEMMKEPLEKRIYQFPLKGPERRHG